MADLISELNLTGKDKGEQAISLIQESLFIELEEKIKDEGEPMVNLIRLALIGYAPEGDRGRMD